MAATAEVLYYCCKQRYVVSKNPKQNTPPHKKINRVKTLWNLICHNTSAADKIAKTALKNASPVKFQGVYIMPMAGVEGCQQKGGKSIFWVDPHAPAKRGHHQKDKNLFPK